MAASHAIQNYLEGEALTMSFSFELVGLEAGWLQGLGARRWRSRFDHQLPGLSLPTPTC